MVQYFRPQTVYVSGLFLQVFAFILGRVLETILPGPNHHIPRLRTRNTAFWRFINPGIFSASHLLSVAECYLTAISSRHQGTRRHQHHVCEYRHSKLCSARDVH